MKTWEEARRDVLAQIAEARKMVEMRDEGGALAVINQQDAFCDRAKETQPPARAAELETQCHYCIGFQNSGGCMGRLDLIDHAVTHGQWDEAGRLLDEYASWVKNMPVPA